MKVCVLSLLFFVVLVAADTLNADNQFNLFNFRGVGAASASYTLYLPVAGFVDVVDAFCAGDQFEVFVDGQSVGKTSTPIPADSCATSNPDPAFTAPDARWSRGRFYVKEGEHSIKINVVQSPYNTGAAYIRAIPGICQGAPSAPFDRFALVADASAEFGSLASKCNSFGLDPAQITGNNIALAAVTAKNCQTSMYKKTTDPVWVRSWNGDVFSGASIALFSTGSSGTINVAGGNQLALCQKKPQVSSVSYSGYQVLGQTSDQKLTLVGPVMAYNQAGSACASFEGAVLAVLKSSDQETYTAASNLVFNTAGPNGQAWVGGYNTKSLNEPLVLNAGSTEGAGSITTNYGTTTPQFYAICAVQGSSGARMRRSAEEL